MAVEVPAENDRFRRFLGTPSIWRAAIGTRYRVLADVFGALRFEPTGEVFDRGSANGSRFSCRSGPGSRPVESAVGLARGYLELMRRNSMRTSIIWTAIGLALLLLAVVLLLLQLGNWWILVGSTGAGALGSGLVNVQRARSHAPTKDDR